MITRLLKFKLSILALLLFVAFGEVIASETTATPTLSSKTDDDDDGKGKCKYTCNGTTSILSINVGQLVKLPSGVSWSTLGTGEVKLDLVVLNKYDEIVATYSSGLINVRGGALWPLGSVISEDIPLGVFNATDKHYYNFKYTLTMYPVEESDLSSAIGTGLPTTIQANYFVRFDTDARSTFRTASSENKLTVDNLTIYPNPTQGIANIMLPSVGNDITVKVYNSLGEEVLAETLKSTGGRYALNTEKLESGIYILKVIQGGQQLQKRFVKM